MQNPEEEQFHGADSMRIGTSEYSILASSPQKAGARRPVEERLCRRRTIVRLLSGNGREGH